MKTIKKAGFFLFLICTTIFASSFNPVSMEQKAGYYLFFDLGDVLLATSKAKSFSKEKKAFLKYFLKHGKPNSQVVKQRLFELMDHQTGYPPRGTATTGSQLCLPAIMCDWLEGKIGSNELVQIVTNIEPNDPFFKSEAEGNLLLASTRLMLPNNLVSIHEKTALIKFFKDCKKHAQDRICIISNWDRDSIPLLKAKFPEIFSDLDQKQLVFSGECGLKKPDLAIYQLAAKQIGVSPQQCILIDDQAENIIAAQHCGWKAIWHQTDALTANTIEHCYKFLRTAR